MYENFPSLAQNSKKKKKFNGHLTDISQSKKTTDPDSQKERTEVRGNIPKGGKGGR